MSQEHAQELPLPALILQLSRDQARLYERHVGMSQSRLTLLLELRQTGEMSQAELVQRLGMEGTLVTRFVKQMEGSGLLTRRSDPRDNRFTLVTLTPAGERIAQQMADFTHTLEAQLLEGLSEEMKAIIRQGLEQIQEKYEQLKEADPTINV
ncbi:MarR family winged helix-turn-helix transcriptional regulator [Dictyobacter kobayashii]|uniref:Transcriptional regulator n=1 Tax=Dictyobacter kobayashii TaxID=2014872 RepID=A0A402ACE8_9CHLR|nr:MarR family transcriptional regulator [Dictyobacter kobayashii]GCE16777.1 transcriptional regulator [Dictyobacter kobayashii]